MAEPKPNSIAKPSGETVKDTASSKYPLEFAMESLQLEEHLQKQIEADKTYWLQNDAKLRAVHQGSLTYDDFRAIVASAHLKPLSKEDKEVWQNMPCRVLWNPKSKGDDKERSATAVPEAIDTFRVQCKKAIPKNTTNFLKDWKLLPTATDKYVYLKQLIKSELEIDSCSANSCAICPMEKIFQEEVPVLIFPDIIQILQSLTNKTVGDCGEEGLIDTLIIMGIMSKSNRFQLTMSFLSKEDKDQVSLLLQNLNANFLISNPNAICENEESNQGYTQEKLLTLLQEVNREYSISNPK